MGCEFNFEKLTAQNEADARTEVEGLQASALYDYGHAGYTGTLAEIDGIVIDDIKGLCNADEVEEYIGSIAEKWGPAIIVRSSEGIFYAGAFCSS